MDLLFHEVTFLNTLSSVFFLGSWSVSDPSAPWGNLRVVNPVRGVETHPRRGRCCDSNDSKKGHQGQRGWSRALCGAGEEGGWDSETVKGAEDLDARKRGARGGIYLGLSRTQNMSCSWLKYPSSSNTTILFRPPMWCCGHVFSDFSHDAPPPMQHSISLSVTPSALTKDGLGDPHALICPEAATPSPSRSLLPFPRSSRFWPTIFMSPISTHSLVPSSRVISLWNVT